MPRLIDLDEAHERIIKYVCQNICDEPRGCSYCRASDAIDALYEMPTVDAEPVRHGKWIHNKWSEMRHDYDCSLCGCRITGVDPFSLSATAYYYCPECGAKMNEEEGENV